jgi:hypothetical protein
MSTRTVVSTLLQQKKLQECPNQMIGLELIGFHYREH